MEKITKSPRKPLIAFIISLFLPGLGQLYNGSVNKASWFFIAFVACSIPVPVVVVLYLATEWVTPVLLTAAFLSTLIWVYSILEATLNAKERKEHIAQEWQGAGTYLLVFILCNLIMLPLMTQHVKDHFVEAYQVPSGSMEPTVAAGDYVLADKRYNCSSCTSRVRRGDIAIFTYSNDRNTNYIKRLIGLPGDRIQIRGETVKINGETISKLFQNRNEMNVNTERSDSAAWIVIWKKIKGMAKPPVYDITVPPGRAFVLGDNRNASNDSRFFDTIPLQDIKGKAHKISFFRSSIATLLFQACQGRNFVGFGYQVLEQYLKSGREE